MNEITEQQDRNFAYQELLERISKQYVKGQAQAVRSVNESLIITNWNIGKYIVEFEQEGKSKAKYGTRLLENLSRDLILRHGRGFSRSNLNYMRLLYLRYPICEKLSHKLAWSHYCENQGLNHFATARASKSKMNKLVATLLNRAKRAHRHLEK